MSPRLCLFLVVLTVHASAAGTNELSARDLSSGRKIYVAKCAKCHQFYEPKAYSETDWQVWMEKMSKKSKLKGDPAATLDRYLDAYRAGVLTRKPEEDPKRPGKANGARQSR